MIDFISDIASVLYSSAVVVGDTSIFVLFLTRVLILSCFASTFIVTIKLYVALKPLLPVNIVTDCPLAATVIVACAGEEVSRFIRAPVVLSVA